MISERNFRDYRVAALVSFWHYIGYLGFPIQMVTRYPTLARFVAARWARADFASIRAAHARALNRR